jgi:hypothetical protein
MRCLVPALGLGIAAVVITGCFVGEPGPQGVIGFQRSGDAVLILIRSS